LISGPPPTYAAVSPLLFTAGGSATTEREPRAGKTRIAPSGSVSRLNEFKGKQPRLTKQVDSCLFRQIYLASRCTQVFLIDAAGRGYKEVALKIVLALVGVLFLALAYPMFVFVRQEPALSMMLSLYATLGVFPLLAIRNPSASRSLIAFTAWSSLVHAPLMGTQVLLGIVARGELVVLRCSPSSESL
jgi:Family of unknown function (DUF6632)